MSQDIGSLAGQLRLLGNQAMRLAADVAARGAGESERSVFQALERDSDVWLIVAEGVYRERQCRREFFEEDLFGRTRVGHVARPVHRREEEQACCRHRGVHRRKLIRDDEPRRLQQLEEHGLLEREADLKAPGRSFVRLFDKGYAKMSNYLWSTRGSMLRERGPSRADSLVLEATNTPAGQSIDAGAVFTAERRAA